MRLLTERRPGTGVVALELFVDAGLLREARPGLAYLTGRMLEEGTATRSAEEIAEAIEDVGGALEVGLDRRLAPGPGRGPAAGRRVAGRPGDPPDLPGRGPDLGPPQDRRRTPVRPRRPRLPGRPDLPGPGLRRSSLRPRPAGASREIARLTREDVVDHHRRYFTPDNAFLVAVGDFDPKKLPGAGEGPVRRLVGHRRAGPDGPPAGPVGPAQGPAGCVSRESRSTS